MSEDVGKHVKALRIRLFALEHELLPAARRARHSWLEQLEDEHAALLWVLGVITRAVRAIEVPS